MAKRDQRPVDNGIHAQSEIVDRLIIDHDVDHAIRPDKAGGHRANVYDDAVRGNPPNFQNSSLIFPDNFSRDHRRAPQNADSWLQIAREWTTVLSIFSGPKATRRRKAALKCKKMDDLSINSPIRESDMSANFDAIDRKIMRELVRDARVSQAVLSERIGLSPTACGRRLQRLEEAGVIRGYSAEIDAGSLGYRMHVIVNITLDRQSENALAAFEKAISKCPDVVSCYLMSGSDDYLVQVQARDMEDYERIHSQHLSRLPGVARLQSSFAMRNVIKRGISAAALAG